MLLVYVLLDDKANVYCVTTDEDIADSWLEMGGRHGVVEAEVDDYTMYNAVADEIEEMEERESE